MNLDDYSVYPKDYLERVVQTPSISDAERDLVDFHRDLVNFYVSPVEANYRVSADETEFRPGVVRDRLVARLPDFFPAELLAKKIAGVRVTTKKRALKQSLKKLEAEEGVDQGEEVDEEEELDDDDVSAADYEIAGDWEDGADWDAGADGPDDGGVI